MDEKDSDKILTLLKNKLLMKTFGYSNQDLVRVPKVFYPFTMRPC